MVNNSITNQVYELVKSIFRTVKNQDMFLKILGINEWALDVISNNSHTKSNIFKFDYYKEFRKEFDYIVLWNNLRTMFDTTNVDREITNAKLRKIVRRYSANYLKENHRANTRTTDSFGQYSEKDRNMLLLYYEIKKNNFDLAYNVYLIMYLAINKQLPEKFYFGANYKKELDEFNDKVICMYGATSVVGIRAILVLSNRLNPNSFALYEKADMYYYGNNHGIEKDLVKAYDLYEDAAGINMKINNLEKSDNSKCHPLALWTLCYMLFNYHRPNTDLANCEIIPKIEALSAYERIEKAILYAKIVLEFTDNGPVANILGKIRLLDESEIPGIGELVKKYNLSSSQEYFRQAAERGYIFSINNLAFEANERIFSDPDNEEMHLKEFIKYLTCSADQYEPYACNILGELYRTGIVERRIGIIGRKTGEIKSIMQIDREKAYSYYLKGIQYFVTGSSALPYANLVIYYKDRLTEEEVTKFVKKVSELGNQKAIDLLRDNLPRVYNREYESFLSAK